MIKHHSAFSYRTDPKVPKFDHNGPVTVMDGHCGLCAKGARWIAKNDRKDEFKIIPIQSKLGQALLVHFDLDADDPTTWLFIEAGRAYASADAVIRVANRMGGIWKTASLLRILPPFILNPLYRLVARNRYRFFGTVDMCNMPDPFVRRKLLQ